MPAPMRQNHKRRITVRQTLWIVGLFAVFLLLLKSLYTLSIRYNESRIDRERAENQISSLTAREQALLKSVHDLGTERGREEELRTRFNVAKPGEEMVVVLDATSTTAATPTVESGGWWQAIKNFFFKE